MLSNFVIYRKIDTNSNLRFEICEFRNCNEKIMFQEAKSATYKIMNESNIGNKKLSKQKL